MKMNAQKYLSYFLYAIISIFFVTFIASVFYW